MRQNLRFLLMLLIAIAYGGAMFGQTTVTDELTATTLGLTKAYDKFSGKKFPSGAEYAGVGCQNGFIQMKNESSSSGAHSGIYTTKSGGVLKSVTVTFNSGNTKGIVSILGSNSAYSAPTSKSDDVSSGDVLISDQKATFTYNFEKEYKYVGIKAANANAAKIDKITIVWEVPAAEKIATKLSFGTDWDNQTITKKVGDDPFTRAAKLTSAVDGSEVNGDVTYKSDKPEVADVDNKNGQVTVKAIGTAVITAIFAGNDTYAPATASYTIEVKKVSLAEDGVFDFSKPENYDYTLPSSDGVAMPVNTVVTAGKIQLKVMDKGSGNGFKWWYDGVLRVYKNAVFQLSAPEGYMITRVTIVPTVGSSKTKYDYYSIEGGAAGENWTGCKNVVEVKNGSNTSRIESITVKYVKVESLTTAASGFATYTASYPVNYSNLGLTAYAVKLNEVEGKVTYTKFTGAVPANEAVLVQGTANTKIELTPAATADKTWATHLKSSDGNVASNGKMYAFSTKNEKSGFYLVQSGVNIPAKKGYLQLTGTTSEAKPFFSFDGGNGTTGIAGVEADADTDWDNAVIYNLAGQRVSKSYKGVVIVNGKKMLRK